MSQTLRHLLGLGKQVDIYVFVDEMQLQWSNISIDLAAGLETALINRMNPRLNGGKSGDKISETKEIEGDFIKNYHNYLPEFRSTNAAASDSRLNKFSIKLGKTYYTNGYLNPGIDISGSLGDDGEQISVQLGLDGDVISSKINRRANLNGSVRIVGNNVLIAEWFKKHFNENDSVECCIINRNQIQLLAPSK
jgi:hypothetical protein